MNNADDFLKKNGFMVIPPENFWTENARFPLITWDVQKIQDKGSFSSQAHSAYMQAHELLPKDFMHYSTEKIKKEGDILLGNYKNIKRKKMAIMLLAHHGSTIAIDFLERYAQNPDPELHGWAEIALWECEGFLENSKINKNAQFQWN